MNTHEKLENAVAAICPEGWVPVTPGGTPLYVYVGEEVTVAARELPDGSRLTLEVRAEYDTFWTWVDAHGGEVMLYDAPSAHRLALEGETFHRVLADKGAPSCWIRDVELREHLGEDYDGTLEAWLEWASSYLSGAVGPYEITCAVRRDGRLLHESYLSGVEAATFDELLQAAGDSDVVWEAVTTAANELVAEVRRALQYGEEVLAVLL